MNIKLINILILYKNDIKKEPINATIKLDKDTLTYRKEEYGVKINNSMILKI